MLFLLMQMGIAAAEHGKGSRAGLEGVKGAGVGVSGPWTEYVRLLPAEVPLPMTWSEEERELLRGTSLEVFMFFSSSHLFYSLLAFFPIFACFRVISPT